MGQASRLRLGLLVVAAGSASACASARSLSAEGAGGPLLTRPTSVGLLIAGGAGTDLERVVREELVRSKRFELRSAQDTGRRLRHSGPGDAAPPTVDEVCAVGRAMNVDAMVAASTTLAVAENTACVRSEILAKNQKCLQYRKTGQFTAGIGATLRIVDVSTCHERASFQVSGSNRDNQTEDGHSPDPVAATSAAANAFRRDLARAIPLAFPIGARVTASNGDIARIDRGAADGLARGQVFGIMRADHKVGHAVVDQVERDSATVEAFTVDAVLERDDVLAESGTTCCIEILPVFTTLRSDVGGDHHVAAGAGLQVAWYRPLSSLLVTSTLGIVGTGDRVTTVLWTVEAGWMWRLVPRRLGLYLVAGGGVADAHRDGSRAAGALGDAALGVKVRLRDNFWVTGEGAWVIGTRIDDWSDPPSPLPYVDLAAPMVRLGIGLRIP